MRIVRFTIKKLFDPFNQIFLKCKIENKIVPFQIESYNTQVMSAPTSGGSADPGTSNCTTSGNFWTIVYKIITEKLRTFNSLLQWSLSLGHPLVLIQDWLLLFFLGFFY